MKPCRECPFSRAIEPGNLGGSSPEVYIGQLVLPFWLPCHCSANYQGKDSDVNKVSQCAGAAIMRANIGYIPPAPLLRLEKSRWAFQSLAHFHSHHTGQLLVTSQAYLTGFKIQQLAITELQDPKVKTQIKRR